MSHYIDIQTKLPTNRKKSPKYRDSNIQQLVEMNLSDEENLFGMPEVDLDDEEINGG